MKARWREPIIDMGEAVMRVRNLRGVWLFPQEGAEGCVTDVTKV